MLIHKDIQFWIMGPYMLFLVSTPLALLRYCVIKKERKKWFHLLGLDVSCIHYNILLGYLQLKKVILLIMRSWLLWYCLSVLGYCICVIKIEGTSLIMKSYMALLLTLHGSDVIVIQNTHSDLIFNLNSFCLIFGMENSLQCWHEGTFYYIIWEYFYKAEEN
jgi:hypothetical protein